MFVLLLLFSLSFSEVAFTLNGSQFSQQSFFNKIPKEEWKNFSNSQKHDLLKDFIFKELVFLESEETNFLYDPLVKSKLDNRINQFLINCKPLSMVEISSYPHTTGSAFIVIYL